MTSTQHNPTRHDKETLTRARCCRSPGFTNDMRT